MNLSTLTHSFLTELGWYPGRAIPPEEVIDSYQPTPEVLHEPAMDYLTEFGNIKVKSCPNPERYSPAFQRIHRNNAEPFEFYDALYCWGGEYMDFINNAIGRKCCPVGTGDRLNAIYVSNKSEYIAIYEF